MLMAVGSMAYLIALSEGLVAARKRPIKIKRSIWRGKWAAGEHLPVRTSMAGRKSGDPKHVLEIAETALSA